MNSHRRAARKKRYRHSVRQHVKACRQAGLAERAAIWKSRIKDW